MASQKKARAMLNDLINKIAQEAPKDRDEVIADPESDRTETLGVLLTGIFDREFYRVKEASGDVDASAVVQGIRAVLDQQPWAELKDNIGYVDNEYAFDQGLRAQVARLKSDIKQNGKRKAKRVSKTFGAEEHPHEEDNDDPEDEFKPDGTTAGRLSRPSSTVFQRLRSSRLANDNEDGNDGQDTESNELSNGSIRTYRSGRLLGQQPAITPSTTGPTLLRSAHPGNVQPRGSLPSKRRQSDDDEHTSKAPRRDGDTSRLPILIDSDTQDTTTKPWLRVEVYRRRLEINGAINNILVVQGHIEQVEPNLYGEFLETIFNKVREKVELAIGFPDFKLFVYNKDGTVSALDSMMPLRKIKETSDKIAVGYRDHTSPLDNHMRDLSVKPDPEASAWSY